MTNKNIKIKLNDSSIDLSSDSKENLSLKNEVKKYSITNVTKRMNKLSEKQ